MTTIHRHLRSHPGFLALLSGIIGLPPPFSPTVPFVILAAWCRTKGSPHFHVRRSCPGAPIAARQERRAVLRLTAAPAPAVVGNPYLPRGRTLRLTLPPPPFIPGKMLRIRRLPDAWR